MKEDISVSNTVDKSIFKIQLLDISTEHNEYAPRLFGNQLIFNISQSDANIYCAEIEGSKVMSPIKDFKISASITQCEYISYSANGLVAAFVKQINPTSTNMNKGIYLALPDKEGKWQLSEPFPFNSLEFSNTTPFISNGGKTLYFSSNREASSDDFDIYISHRVKGLWNEPVKLSDQLNTSRDEFSPYFNNGSLYFSSNGHPGLGGFDLYRAEFTGANGARVYSMGSGINSIYDEKDIIIDPYDRIGYFSSDRSGGAGKSDIYYFEKTKGEIGIAITDANNEAIEDVSLYIPDQNIKRVTDRYGKCQLELTGGVSTRVIINKSGYHEKIIVVKADLDAANQKNYNLQLAMSVSSDNIAHKSISKRERRTKPDYVESQIHSTAYTIQLESLTESKWIDMTQYTSLSSLSNVWKTELNGETKISLGHFSTKESAIAILEKVKNKGFTNAFIKKSPQTNKPKSSEVDNRNNNSEVVIKLASLSSLDNFNSHPFKNFGEVKIVKKENIYSIFLNKLNKQFTRATILEKVKNKGFKDAYIMN